MEQRYLLELIARPAFCVKDCVITQTNESARQRQVLEGTDIRELIVTGMEEYSNLGDGCLYLTLRAADITYGASVTQSGDCHLFLLDTNTGNTELQAVSLAANRLREPLSNILTIIERLQRDQNILPQKQSASLSNSLYQMLRTVYNMSDASVYTSRKLTRTTTENISGTINELLEKAAHTAQQADRKLSYQPLNDAVYALCDKDLLERAVLNLISNAVKFSPEGSTIQAKLMRNKQKLLFIIENSCLQTSDTLKGDIFSRYLREPRIEDGRSGIGLGMVIVRAAAMAHNGAVLWEIPQDQTVRITMTIALRRNDSNVIKSPMLRFDYAGGRDHVLIELSDALPSKAYEDI